MNHLLLLWEEKPWLVIICSAIIVRLIAVIFAGGYGYEDDHFLVIKPAQGWVQGQDSNNWIVDNYEENTSGRSLLYPGLHYVLFLSLETIGIDNPMVKMLVSRLLHAIFSLLVVVYGYRLTKLLATQNHANFVGLLLATFWMLPQISVRNLVEAVPIPLLMIASYWLIQYERKEKLSSILFWVGILFGICFSFRYQTLFFAGGVGLGYLFTRQWRITVILALSTLVPIILLHGVGDWLATGVPFGKVWYYIDYNIINSTSYFSEPWYTYLLILLGVFIPPVSFFLLFGFFSSYKIHFPVWLGVFIFLLFHSIFPNKQERFIFTIIPHLLVFGYLGWKQFLANSPKWQQYQAFRRGSWVFFWIVNLIMVVIYSSYYNKQARIEGMRYLAEQGDVQAIMLVDLHREVLKPAPLFYLEKEVPVYDFNKGDDINLMQDSLRNLPPEQFPNYVVIMHKRGRDISDTPEQLSPLFPELSYQTTASMSLVDRVRNYFNKSIKLDDWVIYRVESTSSSE
ncbi:glycosyltransferase family 39 protein [Tunicatimonas pelagia]|uniref:glycosyltransferase family 39 protein n=1 Tax=Tunicatimonas pelagia TaxID=931531 RepID=UPI002666E805|nr:glycosyltransferase family 39 protein [Tunicatimonas pelagia]WKN40829.1 glycosyltransferase family 39 protein [Tunicatimonas pelagia]